MEIESECGNHRNVYKEVFLLVPLRMLFGGSFQRNSSLSREFFNFSLSFETGGEAS